MKRWAWLMVGLVLGAIAFWPAAFLEGIVQRALPAGASVALSGSIWNGQGQVQLAGTVWPFAWRFAPARLLAAQLTWQLYAKPAGALASTQISVGFSGLTMRAPQFDGEIRALHGLLPALKLAGVQGRAQLSAANLELTPATAWQVGGDGRLMLSELSVAAIGGSTLGTHEFSVRGGGESIAIEVIRSDGTLKLEGRGSVNNKGEYTVQGSALPLTSFDADARARLSRFATLQSDGRFRFDARGKW